MLGRVVVEAAFDRTGRKEISNAANAINALSLLAIILVARFGITPVKEFSEHSTIFFVPQYVYRLKILIENYPLLFQKRAFL